MDSRLPRAATFAIGGEHRLLQDVFENILAIGDEIEMTFRRLFTADGVHNYFWKARPRR